ncbi:MAG: hypothetical protein AAF682_05295 [Planctomycetota bacterium]
MLGDQVTYDLQGDPAEVFGLAISTNTGPTPLAIFDVPEFSSDARRYDPGSNSILGTPSSTERALHGQTTLSNGDVLLAGGVTGDLVLQNFFPPASCRLYDTSANSWTSVPSTAANRVLPTLFDVGGDVSAIDTFDLVRVHRHAERHDRDDHDGGALVERCRAACMLVPRPSRSARSPTVVSASSRPAPAR